MQSSGLFYSPPSSHAVVEPLPAEAGTLRGVSRGDLKDSAMRLETGEQRCRDR